MPMDVEPTPTVGPAPTTDVEMPRLFQGQPAATTVSAGGASAARGAPAEAEEKAFERAAAETGA